MEDSERDTSRSHRPDGSVFRSGDGSSRSRISRAIATASPASPTSATATKGPPTTTAADRTVSLPSKRTSTAAMTPTSAESTARRTAEGDSRLDVSDPRLRDRQRGIARWPRLPGGPRQRSGSGPRIGSDRCSRDPSPTPRGCAATSPRLPRVRPVASVETRRSDFFIVHASGASRRG